MTSISRTQPTGASISEIHLGLKAFVDAYVRIDRWVLDRPATNVIKLPPNPNQPDVLAPYPPNTAFTQPVQMAEFEEEDAQLICEADFYFTITYRFPKQMTYEQLPFIKAQNILNNLYYYAVKNSGQINRYVKKIKTPDIGTEVQVGHVTDKEGDWLVVLNIPFRVNFKAAPGDLDGIQPGSPSPAPIIVNQIKMDIHRAYPNEPNGTPDFDPARLDRSYTFDYSQPEPTPTPSEPSMLMGINL